MSTIQELIQLVAEGDEEAQEELVKVLQQSQQGEAAAKRDLKLKTDKTLRDRYPRALRAFDAGKLRLTDDMDDDAVVRALEEKEDEYASIGVPIEPIVASAPVETPAGGAQSTPAADPAEALTGGGATSGPGGTPRDYVYEIVELMNKGTTVHDQAEWQKRLVELNKSGQKEKIAQITALLEARPILPSGI